MNVQVVITGRSYDAAANVPDQFTLDEGATLDDALKAVAAALPDDRPLPPSCLVAVSGTHLGTLGSHPSRQLADGDELVLIAPVAGG
jgi:molybdopterin converting factor small subunit